MTYVPLFSPAMASTHLTGPHVDFAGLSPLIALLGGAVLVLLVGLLGSRWVRAQLVPALSIAALGAALGLAIWQWNAEKSIVSGALRIDDLSLALNLILIVGGICTVLLAWRSLAARESAHGEFHALRCHRRQMLRVLEFAGREGGRRWRRCGSVRRACRDQPQNHQGTQTGNEVPHQQRMRTLLMRPPRMVVLSNWNAPAPNLCASCCATCV